MTRISHPRTQTDIIAIILRLLIIVQNNPETCDDVFRHFVFVSYFVSRVNTNVTINYSRIYG